MGAANITAEERQMVITVKPKAIILLTIRRVGEDKCGVGL
jgi:hypothetical protein